MANESGGTQIGFLQRPEGKVGIAIPIIGLAVILWFFGGAIGDYIVNAVDNMFHLAVVVGAFVLAGWLVMDSKFRMAVQFLYLSALRMFFSFDPLGNLKSIRTRFIERLEIFQKSLGELRGQRIKTQRGYDAAAKQKVDELSQLAAAQKMNKPLAVQLCANNIKRCDETMLDDANQLALYDKLIERLQRGYDLCSFKIEDMKGEIEHREKQMEDAKISRNIVKSAMGILRGSGMEQDVWDSSNRQIESEYTAALGEVDNLLDMSKGIFEKADLLQEANVQSALTQLDAWTAKNEGTMMGNRQIAAPTPAITLTQTVGAGGKPVYVVPSQAPGDEYDLFKK
jgi:hypothetical protein